MARWAGGRAPPPDPAPPVDCWAGCRVRSAASCGIAYRFVLFVYGSCMPGVMMHLNSVSVAKNVSDHRTVALQTHFIIHELSLCQKGFYERIEIRVQSMTSVPRTQVRPPAHGTASLTCTMRTPLVRRAAPYRCRRSADTIRAHLSSEYLLLCSRRMLAPRLPRPFRPSSDRCGTAHPRSPTVGSTIPEAEARARRRHGVHHRPAT